MDRRSAVYLARLCTPVWHSVGGCYKYSLTIILEHVLCHRAMVFHSCLTINFRAVKVWFLLITYRSNMLITAVETRCGNEKQKTKVTYGLSVHHLPFNSRFKESACSQKLLNHCWTITSITYLQQFGWLGEMGTGSNRLLGVSIG